MEYKDPMFELMSSLEQIVFKKDVAQPVTLSKKTNSLNDFELLRRGTGLKIDDFARAMGVSVSMVHEWESQRIKPTATEMKLMRLIHANPTLSRQLID
ncbi:HTH-type transcriptional regulator [Kosakonia sp. H02]|nr:HTH-type transcriptional regulator [Kosakonia sp. H02]